MKGYAMMMIMIRVRNNKSEKIAFWVNENEQVAVKVVSGFSRKHNSCLQSLLSQQQHAQK